LSHSDSDSTVFVHPSALCESDHVGAGTRIWAFAHVMSGAVVGQDCNIGDHAFIESGAVVGDRVTVKNQVMIWEGVTVGEEVFLGPGVIFTNDAHPRSPRMPEAAARYQRKEDWLERTEVGRGASIGAGAIIICGVTIGSHAMIAAGALVTKNVADYALVVGQPARSLGWVCVCGQRLSDQLICPHCRKRYEMEGDRLRAEPLPAGAKS